MSTEELKQALLHQKTGVVEKDIFDVIAQALELPYAAVARVALALFHAEKICPEPMAPDALWVEKLDVEIRDAIRKAVEDGVRRLVIAEAIESGRPIQASPQAILHKHKAAELCNGCSRRLECMAGSLSTPEKCWEGGIKTLPVFPLRLTATWVEVEAAQPVGKHRIPLHKIDVHRGK